MSNPAPRERPVPFRSLPLVQREFALLMVLGVICALTFAGTKRLAMWSRGRRIERASQWFALGESRIRAGDLTAGVTALEEAVSFDRQNPRVSLALARSLAAAHREGEASRLLLQLRQTEPDDEEINYRLGQLAAAAGQTDEAVRYYTYAMYGLPRAGSEYDRSQIRRELIGMLLDRGERAEALTQLAALDRELPDDPDAQIQAARLAIRAANQAQAFQHFSRALTLDPSNRAAAIGAGEAELALHDFASAARDLSRADGIAPLDPDAAADRKVAELASNIDPLAGRLPAAERVRRLTAGLAHVAGRLKTCGPPAAAAQPIDPLTSELAALRSQPPAELRDPETLARGLDAIGRAETAIATSCSQDADALDHAWVLVVAAHPRGGE